MIVSVDEKPIDNLPVIGFYLFTRQAGERLRVGGIRGLAHPLPYVLREEES